MKRRSANNPYRAFVVLLVLFGYLGFGCDKADSNPVEDLDAWGREVRERWRKQRQQLTDLANRSEEPDKPPSNRG